MVRSILLSSILICNCVLGFAQNSRPVTGDWLGILKIKPYTFRLYLNVKADGHHLYLLNPKANEIELKTFSFENDSIYFLRQDSSSSFRGRLNRETNTIHGKWVSDNHKKYTVTMVPVKPDTVRGLRPRNSVWYTYQKPAGKKDGIQTGDLRDHTSKQYLLDSLTSKIMNESFPNVHSLLISKNNNLVYEEYFYGWKATDLWLIQSVTKSFTGALAGIALANGELKSITDRACLYMPEYRDKACNAQNNDITIHQLLNMSTGLDWNELEFDYHDERNTANLCGRSPDPFDCVLSRRRIVSNGSVFAYNSMNHSIMNKILHYATGLRNTKELKERLLQPLGIEKMNTWGEDFGVIGDISITPRDMMKFGMLYLNKGVRNGKQIVPASWVKESTSTKIQIGKDEGYGYFWWTKQFHVNDKTVETFYAWGYGGQYIFVVPSLNLVMVMTGSNWGTDEKKYAFAMMEKFILPTFD